MVTEAEIAERETAKEQGFGEGQRGCPECIASGHLKVGKGRRPAGWTPEDLLIHRRKVHDVDLPPPPPPPKTR